MTDSRYAIAQFLKSPIAIVNDRGEIHWQNRAFETVFGHGAAEWLRQASHAVAGERGWLQDLFLTGEDGSIVVGKILENDNYAYGFDAQTGEFGNLVTKGIIDPTKVVRIALQDGASIAGLLITTEAMVAEKPKKETPMPAMPPGGGMDY